MTIKQAVIQFCKLMGDNAVMAERFKGNFERLLFVHKTPPERILNVLTLPSWAIDAGTD